MCVVRLRWARPLRQIGGIVMAMSVATTVLADEASGVTYKIVTFGTSLTARGGWQRPLQDALQNCFDEPVAVKAVALSGATSDWAVTKIDEVVAEKPNVILVEFYVNDAAIHRFVTVAHSRDNMTKIVEALKSRLPDARIVFTIMNPVLGSKKWIRPFMESYINAHESVAARAGIDVVDYRSGWAALQPEMLSNAIPDGSHPLPEVAASVMLPQLVAKLTNGQCRSVRR